MRAVRGRGSGGCLASRRAQSHVVGVAVLIGVTVLSMGVLTAGIGGVVADNAAAADAQRVADGFAALRPVASTGPARHRLAFTAGRLRVLSRTLRVLDGAGVVATFQVDALEFTAADRRVVFLAGAVLRGVPGNARVTRPPPLAASAGVLVVGVPVLNASGADGIGGSVATALTLRTDVRHERRQLGRGRFRVAVETRTPVAWERYFAERGATTTRRDFDGDGVPSVVAAFPGERTAYLVVHDLRLEVGV